MRRIDPKEIVSREVDTLMTARARYAFFSRRLEAARKYRLRRAIAGYEFHVGRSLDLLWRAQQRLQLIAEQNDFLERHERLHADYQRLRIHNRGR